MRLELWHLKVSLREHQGHTLVRVTHIRGDKLWNNKPYKDFDPKDSLNSQDARASVALFTQSLGFQFPLPVGPKTWGKVISLAEFPDFESWEKLYVAYTREIYQEDLKLFWRYRSFALRRTHERLFESVRKAATRIAAAVGPLGNSLIPQDQAAYARAALRSFEEDRARLDSFWGEKEITPEAERAVRILGNLTSIYEPEKKQANKKKELAQPDSDEKKTTAKKKGRKAKQVEGQDALW